MKSHSGTVVYIGIMTAVFGLLIMGAASAAESLVFGAAGKPGVSFVLDAADAAGGASVAIIAIGAILLAAGLLMRSGPD